ncbi:MAG: sodium:solute symporter [Gammaproteobacteria bacterium]|nr:MAG: sodium:solute symporter [Gammaproteobacteria bacterium]
MSLLDWLVMGAYLSAMLLLSWLVGRHQRSRKDYYLGGNDMGALPLATSTIATQCSTNSLLGAPAFVGFAAGGGMLWLQYEIAVPLAMLALMLLFGPIRAGGHVSIYAFLEERLGRQARLVASLTFQIFRGVATGVTVYGVATLLTLLLDMSYFSAVLVLMGVTVAYDVLGGMRAVVISDVVQMVLIVAAVLATLAFLAADVALEAVLSLDRTRALDFNWGVREGEAYGFWPMLIGGFFLYAAYYGCDQSQAQRVLAARSVEASNRVLLLNGLLRFPLVLLYCLLGLGLGAYAVTAPEFVSALPTTETGAPNLNMVFPTYVLGNFPAGLVGLVMVGLFAAAMSSIDSALNSLSAATVEDLAGGGLVSDERRLFLLSKLTTFGWGAFAVVFSFQVERIAPTILEAINKIGSMANGPLLALFVIALLTPPSRQTAGKSRQAVALRGFAAGLVTNLCLWLFLPEVSWLWWNLTGFLVALLAAGLRLPDGWRVALGRPTPLQARMLLGMAALIVLVCLALQLL